MEYIKLINIDDIVFLAGMAILGVWLLHTSLGSKALINSRERRNNMPIFLWLFLFTFSYLSISLGELSNKITGVDSQSLEGAFVNIIYTFGGGIFAIVIILIVVRYFFARGLKGFGLNPRTITRDIPASGIYLVVVWPLVVAALTATSYMAKIINDQQYQIPKHQTLVLLDSYTQLPLRISIVAAVVFVSPVLEELLFRGLLQTTIRSYIKVRHSAWLAIILSSLLFTSMHADKSHWPALFLLGTVLGYSYEKNGSLFQPIFIHSAFNAISVINTWN